MPLFKCTTCGCVENTALSNYWTRNIDFAHESGDDCPAVIDRPSHGCCTLGVGHLGPHTRWRNSPDPLTGYVPNPPLCSACDPQIQKWHGRFPQRPWTADDAMNSGMPEGT